MAAVWRLVLRRLALFRPFHRRRLRRWLRRLRRLRRQRHRRWLRLLRPLRLRRRRLRRLRRLPHLRPVVWLPIARCLVLRLDRRPRRWGRRRLRRRFLPRQAVGRCLDRVLGQD